MAKKLLFSLALIVGTLLVSTNGLPAYSPAPAPVPAYGPAPIPAHGPAPVPAHGPAPVPAHGPAPVPAYGPAPVPAYGPAPVPAPTPAPAPVAVPVPAPAPAPAPETVPAPVAAPDYDVPLPSYNLTSNFYNVTCPDAEKIIREEMEAIQKDDPTQLPALLRLHFHDCFVRGCDASVLLNSYNKTAEKNAGPNLSLRGFVAIDMIKTKLEKACPGLVSCADILAVAARDAVVLSGGSPYGVELGRRDGNVSIDKEALTNLPPADGNITTLINLYATKNLTVKDLVVLSGAHTFGVSHCTSFSDRLYNYGGAGDTDPKLDSTYADELKLKCVVGDTTTVVDMDPGNALNFTLGYFAAVWNNKGLFTADAALLDNKVTNAYVLEMFNALSSDKFFEDFGESMIHMGRIGVLTGNDGTVRSVCGSYVD